MVPWTGENAAPWREYASRHAKPFAVARKIGGIDIELDMEGQWHDDEIQPPCGEGTADGMTKKLIAEVRDLRKPVDQRKPLKLIISTNSETHHKLLLGAADVVAPQLYDEKLGHKPNGLRNELVNTWFGYGKPVQPALTPYCKPENGPDDCSRTIFDESVKAIAELSKCGNRPIIGFAIWAEETLRALSTYGRQYLMDTANKPVTVSCDPR